MKSKASFVMSVIQLTQSSGKGYSVFNCQKMFVIFNVFMDARSTEFLFVIHSLHKLKSTRLCPVVGLGIDYGVQDPQPIIHPLPPDSCPDVIQLH